MSRHVNIPVFIPHLGCPNQCVFCNQRTISGVAHFDIESVKGIIDSALLTIEDDASVEIAFFGGSFTGIEREMMISLLEIASGYIKCGRVQSIRCSTRPDYIDEDILCILKKYGVKTIELGLQSVADNVLQSSKRGHNFEAERSACRLIVDYGFELVGQMMIGLPESTLEDEISTCDFIISTGATAARIYPTVVFRDTELCHMVETGEYSPLTLDDAVYRTAVVLERFLNAKINVIRIGLQSSDNLISDKTYFAGPNHAALGELCFGELYYNQICKILSECDLSQPREIDISVPSGDLSKALGQKKKNKIRLTDRYSEHKFRFAESDSLSGNDIAVNIKNGEKKCI